MRDERDVKEANFAGYDSLAFSTPAFYQAVSQGLYISENFV